MTLTVSVYRAIPELEPMIPAWNQLAARVRPQLPFLMPLWHQLWWKHFRQDRGVVRDELRLYALHDASGRLVAVAPMMLTHRPGSGPLRTSQLQFFGADPNITEVRGMVCAQEDEARAVAALAEHLQTRDAALWHWLQWCGLRSSLSERSLQQGQAVLETMEEVPDYQLVLAASWDEFRSGLSRNIKESLRKCYNSLKRDGHEFEFRVISRPEDCAAAIARFIELHGARASASASASGAVRHNNVFATPNSQAFLTEYATEMAARDQLRVFEIAIAGVVVATRIGFVLERTLYLYYSGYAAAWGRYSIMTTVLAEAIKWAIANGFSTVNLSTGRDVSKTRWDPAEIRFRNVVLRAPRWQARLAHGLYARLKGSDKFAPAALLRRR